MDKSLHLFRPPALLAAIGAAMLLGAFGMVAEEVTEGETEQFFAQRSQSGFGRIELFPLSRIAWKRIAL